MKIKRKASDSIETDAQIKEVYTEKVEEICNESLHSNIEYFQDIGDDNSNLEAEKLADQLKYKLLKTHTRLLKVFKFPLRQLGQQMCGAYLLHLLGAPLYTLKWMFPVE